MVWIIEAERVRHAAIQILLFQLLYVRNIVSPYVFIPANDF